MSNQFKPLHQRLKQITKGFVLLSIVISASLLVSCNTATEIDISIPVLNKGDWEIKKQQSLLGAGINLGNMLEAPTEGAWGPVLQEKYFVHVRQLGFTSIRLPIRWSAHVSKTAPYTIDETFFKRVEWAINQARSNGLRVVINIHHFEDLMANPEKEKPVFLSIWRQVSKRFSVFGPEVYFEICNEPKDKLTPVIWNGYAKDALDTIRKTNPYRSVLIGPGSWNSFDAFPQLELPADSFLIAEFHYYKPDVFTHQGAAWVTGSKAWIGNKWRATQSDTNILINRFNSVDAWAASKGVPIYLGEFGSYEMADTLSRILYTSFIAKQAKARGWASAYWKYNYDFGIYDDSTNTTRGYLVDALLKPEETFASHLKIALADTTGIVSDPGSAQFIILDDFEDSLKLQNCLATLYSSQKSVLPESSFCYWGAWYSDSSSVTDNSGNRIITFDEFDSTKVKLNFDNLIGDWGKSGKGLHAKGVIKGGSYPFLGIGTTLPGRYNKDWFDLSELTAVTFWAKGSGEMRIDFTTDTIQNNHVQNWGHFGKDFSLTSEWKYYVIPVKDLKPKLYSLAETDKLTWKDGMKKVCYMDIATNWTYGKVVNTTIDMYIDDIRLYGVTYETFGLKSPK